MAQQAFSLGYHGIRKRSNLKPLSIALCFAAFLVVTILICLRVVGEDNVLAHASKHKPYSVLLKREYYHDFLDNPEAAKIICFGDSNSFNPPDFFASDPRNFEIHMPGLIRDAMKEYGLQSVIFLEWAFAGADAFDYYCLFFPAANLSPDLIIVPINWRAFGDDWLEDPGWFHPELSAFVPFMERLPAGCKSPVRASNISPVRQVEYKAYLNYIYLIGLKAYMKDGIQSLLRTPAKTGNSKDIPADGMEKQEEERVRLDMGSFEAGKKLIGVGGESSLDRYFPMEIRETNPTFQSLRALVHIASRRGTKVLFYIWPLDKRRFAKAGILDESRLARSKHLIAEVTKGESIYFVDLSDMLEHRDFYDAKGHCKISGRRKIARHLASEAASILRESKAAMTKDGATP